MATASPALFAVGIAGGAAQCALAILRPDKSALGKPLDFPNTAAGVAFVQHTLLLSALLPPISALA